MPTPETEARTFVCIARAAGNKTYWHQGSCGWVGLLDADHYPSGEEAVRLLRAMPYMHQFFKDAVLCSFNVAPSPSLPSLRIMDAINFVNGLAQ